MFFVQLVSFVKYLQLGLLVYLWLGILLSWLSYPRVIVLPIESQHLWLPFVDSISIAFKIARFHWTIASVSFSFPMKLVFFIRFKWTLILDFAYIFSIHRFLLTNFQMFVARIFLKQHFYWTLRLDLFNQWKGLAFNQLRGQR